MPLATAVKCKCGKLVQVSNPNQKMRCPHCKAILNSDAAKKPAGKPAPVKQRDDTAAKAETIADTGNARGVEANIDMYETIVSPMAGAGRPATAPGTTPGTAKAEPVDDADTLGPYQIINEIGRGGMGRVLKGYDDSLKRDVAIKVLSPQAQKDVESRVRFVKEAQITGQLEHPGIAPVHFLGWDDHGNEFFSMKLIAGQTLATILQGWHKHDKRVQRQFPLPRLLSIYERVCEAVGFAHSRGVIHRDLKPANVMIGEHGEVWVLDWGLAKVFRGSDAAFDSAKFEPPKELKANADVALTMAGSIVGTPGYLAPEQALGDPLDDGCDIFGLGALLYEILTGQPPHHGKDLHDTVNRAAQGKITPIRRTPNGKNAPAALVAIANKCLALKRKDRYAKVDGLLSDLRAYAAGDAVSVKRDTPLEMAQRFARQHKMGVAIAAGFVVVLATVVAVMQVKIALAGKQVDLAAQERREADFKRQAADLERQKEREARLKAELDKQTTLASEAARATRRLNAFKPYAEAVDLLLRGQLPEKSVVLLKNALKIDPDFPEAQFGLGEALRSSGLLEPAAEAFLKADQLNRKLLQRPNLQAILAAGMCYDCAAYFSKANECFALAEKEGADEPLALVGKAYRLYSELKFREALEYAERAVLRGPHLWEAQLAAGFGHSQLIEFGLVSYAERREKAEKHLRKAYELAPRQAEACGWLAQFLLMGDFKDYAEAYHLYNRAVSLEPQNGARYHRRSMVQGLFGKAAEAEVDLKTAEERMSNPTQVNLIRAKVLNRQKRPGEALALVEKTYRDEPGIANLCVYIEYKLLAKSNDGFDVLIARLLEAVPDLGLPHHLIALQRHQAGDLAGCLSAIDDGLKKAPHYESFFILRAEVFWAQGKLPEALAEFEKIIASHPYAREGVRGKLEVLCKMKRFADARKFIAILTADFPKSAHNLYALVDKREQEQ